MKRAANDTVLALDRLSARAQVAKTIGKGLIRPVEPTEDHVLQFYENDDFLCDVVVKFVAAGLEVREAAIVIATPEHQRTFRARLESLGAEVDRITFLDAETTLSTFMVDGSPDADLFRTHVGGALQRCERKWDAVRVRAYGEMVDVLWKQGNAQAAFRLEELWNDLARVQSMSLLCAYVMGNFYKAPHAKDLRKICGAHGRVVHAEVADQALDLRDANLLFRHAQALEAEVEHRKRVEQALRQTLAARRRVEEQLREANQLKDEFLAIVSHELRTPLTAIAGWAAILKGEGRDNAATIRKGIDVIDRNAKAQGRIIEDLLDVSRMMRGQVVLDLQPVSLVAIVADAVDSLKTAARASGVTLVFEPDEDACSAVCDVDRVRQVVCNLLTNAIKFTPEGGRVEVRLLRRSEHVAVIVADTGKGIDVEFLPHVFDRFRQGQGGGARRQGLGLGLAIVRHLVELHGGRVVAESEGAGKGTTFTVTLPLTPPSRRVQDGGPESFAAMTSRTHPNS